MKGALADRPRVSWGGGEREDLGPRRAGDVLRSGELGISPCDYIGVGGSTLATDRYTSPALLHLRNLLVMHGEAPCGNSFLLSCHCPC